MSSADLERYVGATSDTDAAFVETCWDQASALVLQYVRGVENFPLHHPEVFHRAVLEVAAELFHRRQAPGGLTQFAAFDSSAPAPRMARDPMVAAYHLLNPFLPPGIA